MKIIIVSGGFDPLHSGHIEYFKAARELGDKLIVAVNSDAWLERKKGRAFLPCHERISIIENLKMVDGVILFNDNDDTAIEAIKMFDDSIQMMKLFSPTVEIEIRPIYQKCFQRM
jgi:cytidyltransferase-like protein